jgi:hypothetical protein
MAHAMDLCIFTTRIGRDSIPKYPIRVFIGNRMLDHQQQHARNVMSPGISKEHKRLRFEEA